MLRISGVLSILLTRRTKDNTVNKSKATDPVRIKEAIRFSTAYKNDGNITQAIAITNRLLPVSSPLFTTEIMRRFDAIINVEQMIKKDFLFIQDTSQTRVYIIFRFMNDIRYFGKEKVLCSIQDVSITIQDLDEIFLKTVLY